MKGLLAIASAVDAMLPSAPNTKRSDKSPAALSACQRETRLTCGIFIESYKITKGHRKKNVLRRAERICSERSLESRYYDREAQ